MDDLISRQISVLTLLEKGQKSRRYKLGEIWELNFDEIREALETVPSVDAVEVVRCEDCEHWERKEYGGGMVEMLCQKTYDFNGFNAEVEPNHFCSYGERKTDVQS